MLIFESMEGMDKFLNYLRISRCLQIIFQVLTFESPNAKFGIYGRYSWTFKLMKISWHQDERWELDFIGFYR